MTAKMLSKYPSGIPSKEYVPLLTVLHQLQIECKRYDDHCLYLVWCFVVILLASHLGMN